MNITKAAIGERIEAVEKRLERVIEHLVGEEEASERSMLASAVTELSEIRFLVERDVFFPATLVNNQTVTVLCSNGKAAA